MQGHNTVATHSVGQRKGRGVGAAIISHAVDPLQTVTNHLLINAGSGLADRQFQSVHALTTSHRVSVLLRVNTRRVIRLAVPYVLVAGILDCHQRNAAVHRQVQRHHGVTTRFVRNREDRRVRALRVEVSVDPAQTVTNHLLINAGSGLADRQFQSVHALTTSHRVSVLLRVNTRRVIRLAVPYVLVAGILDCHQRNAAVHRQVQRHDAVAVSSIGQRKGRGAGAAIIGHAVDPLQTVTNHLGVRAVGLLADSQLQRVVALTACLIVRILVRVNATFRVRLAVPRVGITSVLHGHQRDAAVHRQIQRHDAVAVSSIGQRKGRGAGAAIIGHAVDPLQTVTNHLGVRAVGLLADGQLQRVIALTSRLIVLILIHINPTFRVGLAIPHIVVAGVFHGHHRHTVVDRQFQRHQAVTTVHRRIMECRSNHGRFGVFHTMPRETIACHDRRVALVTVVDRQMHPQHTVAIIVVRQRLRIDARFLVRLALPRVAVTFRLVKIRGIRTIDRHVQGHHTVAAVHVMERTRVNAAGRDRRVTVRLAPDVAVTSPLVQIGGFAVVVYRQVHRHHTVTTIPVRQRLRVITGLRICCALPYKTVTLRLGEFRGI